MALSTRMMRICRMRVGSAQTVGNRSSISEERATPLAVAAPCSVLTT